MVKALNFWPHIYAQIVWQAYGQKCLASILYLISPTFTVVLCCFCYVHVQFYIL